MLARTAFVLSVLLVAAGAASAKTPTGFFGCRTYVAHHPAAIVKPRSIVVACADGNFFLTGIRWTAWTSTNAAGTATAHLNDCKPYCAAGHFHTYAATVTLSTPRACKGARVFTRVAWRYVRAKPAGAARTGTIDFGCR